MTVRLYAGNLPPEVDRDAFEALFTAAAEILSVKVVRDRKTNRCRGFAFVTVSTPEIAEALIAQLNGSEFAGQPLKLEVAQPREKENGEGGGDMGEDVTAEDEETTGERPRLPSKKRPKTQEKREKVTAATSVEPDPRWASQLQRIKEQLMATGQS